MFSENLKKIRKEKGYTLEKISELYNSKFGGKMNKGTLSRYEQNKQEPLFPLASTI